MSTAASLLLWLHLVAVTIWVGGLFYTVALLFPLPLADEAKVVRAIHRRMLRLSYETATLVVVTGLFNLLRAGSLPSFSFAPSMLWILAAKGGLLGLSLALQTWLVYGPGRHLPGPSARRRALLLGILLLLSALAALYLGVRLH